MSNFSFKHKRGGFNLIRTVVMMSFIVILSFKIAFSQPVQHEIYYRVYFEANPQEMNQLRNEIIFEHLARNGEGYSGEFNESEKDILITKARNARVLISDMTTYYRERAQSDLASTRKTRIGGVPANFHGGTMGGYMTLNEAIQNMDSMYTLFPALVKPKEVIGTTEEGRLIYLYKISDNPLITEPEEQEMLFTALHHAREPQSLAQLVYFMWYLLENYNTSDSLVQHLVDDRQLYFIPVLNPDGYAYNEFTNPGGGGMWRKNRRVNSATAFGVDLNRNYAFKFAHDNSGSSGNPAGDTYRGPSAFSEPETQAVRDLCLNRPFKLIMNYHSYGEWLLHPWGYVNQVTPDDAIFTVLADRFTAENGYTYGTCFQTLAYLANGVSDDWHYGEQTLKPKTFAMTPEVGSAGDGFWPLPSQIIPISQENLTQNFMAAWMSGPYIEQNRVSPFVFTSTLVNLQYAYSNYGLDTCLQLKSWFESSNPFVLSSDTFTTNNLMSQQTINGMIPITLNSLTPINSNISGRIYTRYNNFLFSDTASFNVQWIVGINDFQEHPFVLYPNPGSGQITLESSYATVGATLFIKDAIGRTVMELSNLNGTKITLNVGSLTSGIYTVELSEKGRISRTRLVLE